MLEWLRKRGRQGQVRVRMLWVGGPRGCGVDGGQVRNEARARSLD